MKFIIPSAIIAFSFAEDFPFIQCPGQAAGLGDSLSVFCNGKCEVEWKDVSTIRKEKLLEKWDDMCFQLDFPDGYTGNRNIVDHMSGSPQNAQMSNIRGYGCWCSMSTLFRKGHGPVQNRLDENCKKLHLGYDCVKMDAKNEGTTCDTSEDEYFVMPVFNTASIDFLCQTFTERTYGHLSQPKLNCAVRLCSVESRFIAEIITDFMNGGSLDFSKIHDTYGGPFNFDSECFVPPGTTDRQCCGLYPFRFPFNTLSQECCAKTTPAGVDSFKIVPFGSC